MFLNEKMMRSTVFQREAWEANQYAWDKVDGFQNFSVLATMKFLMGHSGEVKASPACVQ